MNDPSVSVSKKLSHYLDAEGRLKAWPSKRTDLLKALHTFGDWALLRRDLYDARIIDRSPDGRRYWKVPRTDNPRA